MLKWVPWLEIGIVVLIVMIVCGVGAVGKSCKGDDSSVVLDSEFISADSEPRFLKQDLADHADH